MLVQLVLVLTVFYFVGRIAYGRKKENKYKFVKVLFNFFTILFTNSILLLIVVGAFSTSILLLDHYFYGVNAAITYFINSLKVSHLLITIFIIIFIVAILQYYLRIPMRKASVFSLDDDDYLICEYLIQWTTIYLAVYQFLFAGLKSLTKFTLEVKDVSDIFSTIVSPDNLNIVIQPLLIAAWIAIVMEKIRVNRDKKEKQALSDS